MTERLRFRFPLISLPVLFILAGSACTRNETIQSELIVTRDSLGITIVENNTVAIDRVCSISEEPVLSIGKEFGEEPYLLYRVFDSTRLSDGRIAIVNQGSSEIRVFEADGQFSHSFGREGEGPGEFRRVSQIWTLPGDTLWVGDYRPWRFHVFDAAGQLIRAVSPEPSFLNPPDEMGLLSDGRSVLGKVDRSDRSTQFKMQDMGIVLHSRDGLALDTLGVFSYGELGTTDGDPNSLWVTPLFEARARLAAHGSKIAIGHGSRTEVSVIEAAADNKLKRLIRWTTEDRTVSQEHVSFEYERFRSRYAEMDATTRRRSLNPRVSPNRPIRDQFPAFKRLLYGRDGRLWVQEYLTPGEDDSQSWLVFNEDGRFACRVDLNKDLEVDEVGSDYVLGGKRSELGVERIVMYELSGASPGTDSVSISEDSDD